MKPKTFVIKWKRRFFWNSEKCEGFRLLEQNDRMIIFLENGIREIPKWSECECKLGKDFLESQKTAETVK